MSTPLPAEAGCESC